MALIEDLVPFPLLPAELVRYIFELTVLTDKPTALALALVSSAVNAWVIPLIYRTVTLDTQENILSFIDGLCASMDNSRYVCSFSAYRQAMRHCDWALSLCNNVQQLLLCPPNDLAQPMDESIQSVSLWPRPWYILLLKVNVPWISRRIELFAHTTHLYLDEGFHPSIIELWVGLPLTHICIGLWGDQENGEHALQGVNLLLSMPYMKVVLIHALISGSPIDDFYGGIWEDLADIADERLFVAPGMLEEDLGEIFNSGKTIWDSVEEFKDWRQRAKAEDM